MPQANTTIKTIGDKTESLDLTSSRAQFGTDFKQGIADAQRARKMLLASFST